MNHERIFRDKIMPLKDNLFKLALRLTLNPHDAEDIVQDTLIKIWNKRNEWQHIDSLEAYSVTVCKHLALDSLKHNTAHTIPINPNAQHAAEHPSPFDNLSARDNLQILRQALNTLPQKQRDIFTLREIEGLSYKQISATLNISEQQVKVYLLRARQKIKLIYIQIQKHGL